MKQTSEQMGMTKFVDVNTLMPKEDKISRKDFVFDGNASNIPYHLLAGFRRTAFAGRERGMDVYFNVYKNPHTTSSISRIMNLSQEHGDTLWRIILKCVDAGILSKHTGSTETASLRLIFQRANRAIKYDLSNIDTLKYVERVVVPVLIGDQEELRKYPDKLERLIRRYELENFAQYPEHRVDEPSSSASISLKKQKGHKDIIRSTPPEQPKFRMVSQEGRKVYNLSVVIQEGDGGFWETLEGRSGCDEIVGLMQESFLASGMSKDDFRVKLVKFEEV